MGSLRSMACARRSRTPPNADPNADRCRPTRHSGSCGQVATLFRQDLWRGPVAVSDPPQRMRIRDQPQSQRRPGSQATGRKPRMKQALATQVQSATSLPNFNHRKQACVDPEERTRQLDRLLFFRDIPRYLGTVLRRRGRRSDFRLARN